MFPDIPRTQRPAETRMGKGKGSVDHWVCSVKPGKVLFEIDGIDEQIAKEALNLAKYKLPVKTKIIVREQLV